ncbi:glycoside hydrolase family 57 protein [Limnochorda pilosa]|uniref:Glycoside hydrolase n=1 Tax=Limnochorda pilosa TaxID=1555112 RepID=A0A0K2SJ36_LIMPI|nr:1,4-alpha-glucan branching protein domain-containing protein [Limnochorda pilosa]BAS27136.1 glycoside hydrolase [Limnochorda pilosa]
MAESLGRVALVLHAHLPFVRHPEHPDALEEGWLHEAMAECYIPLLARLERLAEEGVPFRLSFTLTPTLAAMLRDPLLQDRFTRRLELMRELAGREEVRARNQPALHRLARFHGERLAEVDRLYRERYHRDLIAPLARLQEAGHVEVLASAATHGYLPLMDVVPQAVEAQVAVGVQAYQELFGRPPRGFWLPECAFHPGHDRILRRHGVEYTIVDAHGLLFGRPRPVHAVYEPAVTGAGLAVFGRDWESSKQVWSATEGYPGDPVYRDFYRDVGWDLDWEYVRPYLRAGVRGATGFKYHRITGPTPMKELYDPDAGRERARVHAGNFVFNRAKQVEYLAGGMDRPPVVVSPYDAELFGHWWFEGPDFLEDVLRFMAGNPSVHTTTPAQHLDGLDGLALVEPTLSSWGYKGYNEVWLEGSNDWIYRHLHKAAERMVELADRFPHAGGLERRALNQAARELLLAQASDWAFIMKTGTMVEYARRRVVEHLERFLALHQDLVQGAVDPHRLALLEERDNLFPFLDYSVYASRREAAEPTISRSPASA